MRWIILFVVISLIEWYTFQAIKTVTTNKWIRYAHIVLSFLILFYIVLSFTKFDRSVGQNQRTLFTFALILLVYVPKLIITFFLMIEDIIRLLTALFNQIFQLQKTTNFIPARRKFISQAVLGIASIPFVSLLYGIAKGRYNYKVIHSTVYFDDLPKEFDGFKIMQISDLHVGSLDNPEKVSYGVNLINEQDFDLLVFTGDLVNTFAKEIDPWINTFSKIKNPTFGKFAVLGNHDYGEYTNWKSPQDKEENFQAIKNIFPKIGFELLLNEHKTLHKNNSNINIIGVENWGRSFKKAGDLHKASQGLTSSDFKIVLSHDPSHWDLEIKDHPLNYQLTLSGHTHGMQFGIEIPGFIKWSPVQYVYKHWAGLYQNAQKYLYVNRGFGYHAYPGRTGIWPEITIIELKQKTTKS